MSVRSLSRPRALLAAAVMGTAVTAASLSAPAISSAVAPSHGHSASRAMQPIVFVYYRCYVRGYGWMYCAK